MKFRLITSNQEILESNSSWNEVAGPRPFFRWEWMANWLIEGVERVTPAVLVGLDDNDNWIGIAPFCVESKPLAQKLRLLGSGTACSDYLGLIAQPEFERSFAEAVADWLSIYIRPGGLLGKIDVIEWEGINLADENSKYFFELMMAAGFKSHTVPLEGCWAVNLMDNWDEMNRSFSKSLRRKTKKAVQQLGSSETKIVSTDDCDLAEVWPIFVDLHQKRRQMLDQAGCFADSRFESFLKKSMQAMITNGRAELIVIDYCDRPLASFLLFNDGCNVFMYQSGMDPENISLIPGYQIAVLALQRSITKGFQRFDFLRGDEPYKARWLTERIPLSRTRFIPRNLRSQLKHGIWQTGFSLKQYLKSSPGPGQTESE